MSAGFSALSSALFALAWTIPDNRFITLMLVGPFSVQSDHDQSTSGPARRERGARRLGVVRSRGGGGGAEQRGATVVFELGPQRPPIVVGEKAVAQLSAVGAPQDRVGTLPSLGSKRRLGDLARGGEGEARRQPHEAGRPLGPEVRLGPEEGREAVGVEGGAGAQFHRGHDLVAGAGIGHGVHGGRGDVGVALDHPLDRRGGEVLRVDSQPVTAPTPKVEVPEFVAVAEVTGPVPVVSYALGVPGG